MLIVYNQTATAITYQSRTITVPASGSLNCTPAQAIVLASDTGLLSDFMNGNCMAGDGIKLYAGTEAVDFVRTFFTPLQFDSDGALLSRVKAAPTGWSYQLRAMELTTGIVGAGIINNDYNGASLSDVTVLTYNASGAAVTDAALNSTITKTVLDFEPAFDYYIVSGAAKALQTPTTNVYLSVVGVPDYPPAYGGTKVFIQNVNFKYLSNEKVTADGRAAKALLYNNPGPHTNKMRFILFHDAGLQMQCELFVELYKV